MRTPDQVQAELLSLPPDGWVFPADPDTYFGALFRPMAVEWSRIELSMDSFQAEIDPRSASNLLLDYQRVLGPDPCGRDQLALNTSDVRLLTYQRWTAGGKNVCPGYFIDAAAAIGVAMTITEFPRTMAGRMQAGQALCPSPNHMTFLVSLPAARVRHAMAGGFVAGESLGSFTPNLMECVVRTEAPLYTQPYFTYH